MDTNHKTIPEEILFIILTMLPAKSLLRFRCVSKHWLSIISDPYFVDAHYSRSKSCPKLLISVKRGYMHSSSPDDELSFYSIDYPEEDRPPNLHATAHSSINCPSDSVISSSKSGIICFNSHQAIRIGNPITGEFNLIIQHPAVAGDSPNAKFARHYFGIDPIDGKKVVLRLDLLSNQDEYFGRNNRLFSLLESQWQWHDTAPLTQPLDNASYSSICMNGVIYFTANVRDDFDRQLYAFDVRLESFERFRCPHNVTTSFGSRITEFVIEYKDHVALVGYSRHVAAKVTNEIHMWILENPKEHSWSFKSFEVPWTDFFTRISSKLSGATRRGELVFATGRVLREGYINLYLFEIDTNTLRRFQVDGLGTTDPTFPRAQLSFLIESLESPKEVISLS